MHPSLPLTLFLPLFTLLPTLPLTTAALLPLNINHIDPPCSLESGTPGAVYLCRTMNFNAEVAGDCVYIDPSSSSFSSSWSSSTPFISSMRTCIPAPFKIQSIGPDAGGYCVVYEDAECRGSVISAVERSK